MFVPARKAASDGACSVRVFARCNARRAVDMVDIRPGNRDHASTESPDTVRSLRMTGK